MNLDASFKYILGIASARASFKIEDPDTELVLDVMGAYSNYSRKLEAPAEMIISGVEIVLLASSFNDSFPSPKRGHKIRDNNTGDYYVIDQPEPMIITGKIVGYRCRTE